MILHGIDIVNLDRDEFKHKNIYTKILHRSEYNLFLNLDSLDQQLFLAKMWAIKEAIYKAIAIKLNLTEIIITKNGDIYDFEYPGYIFTISTSCENNLIIASVVGIKKCE